MHVLMGVAVLIGSLWAAHHFVSASFGGLFHLGSLVLLALAPIGAALIAYDLRTIGNSILWTLRALFESPLATDLTFKGGTSLSKVYKIIDRCREHGTSEDHLLARLLAARTEDGEAMSRTQLRDEVVTMMLAGHETTALLLMYRCTCSESIPSTWRACVRRSIRCCPVGAPAWPTCPSCPSSTPWCARRCASIRPPIPSGVRWSRRST